MAISVQWGFSLKFHPSAFVVHRRGGKTNRSTCIKRSSRRRESGGSESIVPKLSGNFGIQDFQGRFGLCHSCHLLLYSQPNRKDFSFPPAGLQRSRAPGENHADTVRAPLLGCVSHAVWIPWGRLRGDCPDELQRHQKPARCCGQ